MPAASKPRAVSALALAGLLVPGAAAAAEAKGGSTANRGRADNVVNGEAVEVEVGAHGEVKILHSPHEQPQRDPDGAAADDEAFQKMGSDGAGAASFAEHEAETLADLGGTAGRWNTRAGRDLLMSVNGTSQEKRDEHCPNGNVVVDERTGTGRIAECGSHAITNGLANIGSTIGLATARFECDVPKNYCLGTECHCRPGRCTDGKNIDNAKAEFEHNGCKEPMMNSYRLAFTLFSKTVKEDDMEPNEKKAFGLLRDLGNVFFYHTDNTQAVAVMENLREGVQDHGADFVANVKALDAQMELMKKNTCDEIRTCINEVVSDKQHTVSFLLNDFGYQMVDSTNAPVWCNPGEGRRQQVEDPQRKKWCGGSWE